MSTKIHPAIQVFVTDDGIYEVEVKEPQPLPRKPRKSEIEDM